MVSIRWHDAESKKEKEIEIYFKFAIWLNYFFVGKKIMSNHILLVYKLI
jgi:hypothetical protein